MRDVGARRGARGTQAENVQGRAGGRAGGNHRIDRIAGTDNVAGSITGGIECILHVLEHVRGRAVDVTRVAVVGRDLPVVGALTHGKITVDAHDAAGNDLVGHRASTLQIGIGAVDIEVLAVPVRIEGGETRRWIGKRQAGAVSIERVLNCRPVGSRQERVVYGNSPGPVHLARGAEEWGAIARLSDQVGRVPFGEPALHEEGEVIGELEIPQHVEIGTLRWREQIGELR